MSTNHVPTDRTATDPTATNHDDVDKPTPAPTRQCSRCRVAFPVDDTLLFTAEYAWWLCPACSSALLGKPSR